MLTEKRLASEIEELMNGKETVQTYEKLASLMIVQDHVYPKQAYSASSEPQNKGIVTMPEYVVDDFGNTEFLRKIQGKSAEEMWLLMDDLMEVLAVINPRLYNSIIDKI